MKSNIRPIRSDIEINYQYRRNTLFSGQKGRIAEYIRVTKRAVIDAIELYAQSGQAVRESLFPRTTHCVRYFQTLSLGVLTTLALSGEQSRDASMIFDHRQRSVPGVVLIEEK